jgi:hypothetical protein
VSAPTGKVRLQGAKAAKWRLGTLRNLAPMTRGMLRVAKNPDMSGCFSTGC